MKADNYFRKKLHLRCSTGFWMHLSTHLVTMFPFISVLSSRKCILMKDSLPGVFCEVRQIFQGLFCRTSAESYCICHYCIFQNVFLPDKTLVLWNLNISRIEMYLNSSIFNVAKILLKIVLKFCSGFGVMRDFTSLE